MTEDKFTGVVLFSAPWCGPCKGYKPVLQAWAQSRGVELKMIDVEADPLVAKAFGIRAVPTTMLIKEGATVRSFTGAKPEGALDGLLGA